MLFYVGFLATSSMFARASPTETLTAATEQGRSQDIALAAYQ